MGAASTHSRRVHRQWSPHIGSVGRKRESRRHYTGDRVASSIQRDSASDYIPRTAVMTPPKRIADDRDARADFIVLLLEIAAERWVNLQYMKEICRNLRTMDLLGIAR